MIVPSQVLSCFCQAGAIADRLRDGGMPGGQYRPIPHTSLQKGEKTSTVLRGYKRCDYFIVTHRIIVYDVI